MDWHETVARYAWAESDDLMAYTFSVISGATEDDVVRAFGGDPGDTRRMTFDEAADESAEHLYQDHALLGVVTLDRHVLTIESGYHGSLPEIAERASAGGGEFFSVYTSVNGVHQVLYAVDGKVDGMVDPADLEDAAWMDPAPVIPGWAQGVDFHLESVCAESFALMERVTGAVVDPGWLTAPLRTVRLPPLDVLLGDQGTTQPS
ncbi:DUF6461 domain-containing protein [Streptomyces sp. NPDC059783]|uniref:DUF6461 domain-containing protein n=1 Tax=Streptomyces sp. NPDC059783 TaxID=3346944 RepID=UPI0036667DE4